MSTSSKTAQATLALRHIRTGRGEEVEARIAGPGGGDLRLLVVECPHLDPFRLCFNIGMGSLSIGGEMSIFVGV